MSELGFEKAELRTVAIRKQPYFSVLPRLYIFLRRTIGRRINNWGIPEWLEIEVKERDKVCIYCGIQMIDRMPRRGSGKNAATWEHIVNDATIISRENIARCCVACNSSKGTKKLSDWIQSSYCKKRGIKKETIAEVVKKRCKGK